MSVKGEIERGAENKDVLVTTAVMTYESGKDNKKNELIDYATNRVKENKETALAANSAYLESNKFLPNTLLDWLTLILVISGLVLVGKNLYKDLPSPKPEKVKVAKSLE
jgi:hypothetical protein